LVWEFYAWRRELVSNCEPNHAHLLLANLEAAGEELHIITQNVDGLHQTAGNKNVIELHGSLWKLKCTHCDHKWVSHEVPLAELPPKCPRCGELARPDVVWFGESLDHSVLSEAYSALEDVDTVLVIGTSALVYPAAGLPLFAKEHGAFIVEINPQETPITDLADQIFREPATSGVEKWWQLITEGN
jgi:NAD-dependent deacetylase